MFDIKEYYESQGGRTDRGDGIVNIDADIAHDIGDLLSSRFESLYRRDRYKHAGGVIEILYPALQYPGPSALLLGPDRIRHLLSFYPEKSEFRKIEKIVLRPRFVEIGSIELVSLYLRRKKILVLYLFHPHFYRMSYTAATGRDESYLRDRLIGDAIKDDEGPDVHAHPLWYLITMINGGDDEGIDKFFIKKDAMNDRIYEVLNDISFFYSRHGY
ncbi:MAG: hypothetical protein JW838_16055 [Spirochaetes bacterium]|nr:hypothetical protein [Spirochaetota bacterium]